MSINHQLYILSSFGGLKRWTNHSHKSNVFSKATKCWTHPQASHKHNRRVFKRKSPWTFQGVSSYSEAGAENWFSPLQTRLHHQLAYIGSATCACQKYVTRSSATATQKRKTNFSLRAHIGAASTSLQVHRLPETASIRSCPTPPNLWPRTGLRFGLGLGRTWTVCFYVG